MMGGSDYSYWTDKLTKGRLKANNIETFFHYFMLVKMQSPDIRTSLTPIEKKQYPSILRISFIMFAQGTWTPVSYLLYILKNVKSYEEKVNIFGYLENYLVRRIACGSSNNNYSDLFSQNLIGQGVCTFKDFKG